MKQPVTHSFFSLVGGALIVLTAVGCASTPPSVIQLSGDGRSMSLQQSRDGRSLVAARPNEAAIRARDDLKGRKDLSEAMINSLAELSFVGGQIEEASTTARNQLKKDFKNTEALEVLVKVAIFQNRYDEALLLASNGLTVSPRSTDLMNLRGVAHYMLGDAISAREDWKKAININPGHVSSQMNLAALFFQHGHMSQAGAGFERVLAVQPQNSDALIGRAMVLSQKGQHEQARNILLAVQKTHSKSPLVLYNLAILERDKFENYEKSLEYVESQLAVQGQDRVQAERSVAMREDLRRLIAARQQNKLSDSELRQMASKSSQAVRGNEVAEGLAAPAALDNSQTQRQAAASGTATQAQPAAAAQARPQESRERKQDALPVMTKETENINDLENAIK